MNKKITLITLLSVIALTMAACKEKEHSDTSSAESKAESVQEQFVLSVGETISYRGYTLEFMEVTGDSRCAEGVQCVWSGNGQAIFMLTSENTAQTVTLNTAGGLKYPKSFHINGHNLKLLALDPYPQVNIKIDPSAYQAQLVFAKSERAEPVIIDVRSADEFAEGHYPNAVNLPHDTISETIISLKLNMDAEIIVYCRSGRRSGLAKEALDALGYTDVFNGKNQDNMHKIYNTEPQ